MGMCFSGRRPQETTINQVLQQPRTVDGAGSDGVGNLLLVGSSYHARESCKQAETTFTQVSQQVESAHEGSTGTDDDRDLLKALQRLMVTWAEDGEKSGWTKDYKADSATQASANEIVKRLQKLYDKLVPTKIVELAEGRYDERFDMFLSHRGSMKQEYVGTAYDMLEAEGYHTFYDREVLEVAEYPSNEMWWAMTTASCGLAVLSQDFFKSEWCMREFFVLESRYRQWLKPTNEETAKQNEVVRSFRGLCLVIAPEQFWFKGDVIPSSGRDWVDIIKNSPLKTLRLPLFAKPISGEDLAAHVRKNVLETVQRVCTVSPFSGLLVDWHSICKEYFDDYLEGTRAEILKDIWTSCEKQPLTVFCADAGMGKSTIMAKVISDGLTRFGRWAVDHFGKVYSEFQGVTENQRATSASMFDHATNSNTEPFKCRVVAVHFFRHDDAFQSSWKTALLSISEQLCKNVPGFSEMLRQGLPHKRAGDDASKHKKELNDWLTRLSDEKALEKIIVNPLVACERFEGNAVIVLDALDECSSFKSASHAIARAWKIPEGKGISLLVSQRDVKNELYSQPGLIRLNLNSDENHDNITKYIHKILEGNNWDLGEKVFEELVQEIVKRSTGVFLWLRYQKEILKQLRIVDFHELQGKSELKMRAIIEQRIKDLPQGIEKVYEDYFRRLLHSLKDDKALYRRVVSFGIVLPQSPIPELVWLKALGASVHNMSSRQVYEENLQYPSSCLFVFRNEEVRAVHKSLKDWVAGDDKESARFTCRDLAVEAEFEDHRTLAIAVDDIFDSDDIRTGQWASIVEASARARFNALAIHQRFAIRYASLHWIEAERLKQHLLATGIAGNERKQLQAQIIISNADTWFLDFQRLYWKVTASVSISNDVSLVFDELEALIEVSSKANELRMLLQLLNLSRVALSEDSRELAGQILGRVPESKPQMLDMRQNALQWLQDASAYVSVTLPISSELSGLNSLDDRCKGQMKVGSVKGMSISENGELAAVIAIDGSLVIWNLVSGQKQEFDFDDVSCTCFSPSTGELFFGNYPNPNSSPTIVRLDPKKPGESKTFGGQAGFILLELGFSSSDTLMSVWKKNNSQESDTILLRVHEQSITTGEEKTCDLPREQGAYKHSFFKRRWVITKTNPEHSNLVAIWRIGNGYQMLPPIRVDIGIYSPRFQWDDILPLTEDRIVYNTRLDIRERIIQFSDSGIGLTAAKILVWSHSPIAAYCISSDSRYLAWSDSSANTFVLNLVTGARSTFRNPVMVEKLWFAGSDRLLAYSGDEVIRIWEFSSGGVQRSGGMTLTSTPHLRVSPNGGHLIWIQTSSNPWKVEMWDLGAEARQRSLDIPQGGCVICCDKYALVMYSGLARMIPFDSTSSLRETTSEAFPSNCHAALSHDGRKLILGYCEANVVRYDVCERETGRSVYCFTFPTTRQVYPRYVFAAFAPKDSNLILLLTQEDTGSSAVWFDLNLLPVSAIATTSHPLWRFAVDDSHSSETVAISANAEYAFVRGRLLDLTLGCQLLLPKRDGEAVFSSDSTKLLIQNRYDVTVWDISGGHDANNGNAFERALGESMDVEESSDIRWNFQKCLPRETSYDLASLSTVEVFRRPRNMSRVIYLSQDYPLSGLYGTNPDRSFSIANGKFVLLKHLHPT